MLFACGRSPASFDALLMGAFAFDLRRLALSQRSHPLLPLVPRFRRYANDANARCDDLVLAWTETSSLQLRVGCRGDVFDVAELPNCERTIDLRRITGRHRHGRHNSSVASRASERARLNGTQTRIPVTLWSSATKTLICSLHNRTARSNTRSGCCTATNGVCYGNMEVLNDLRSASGKGWIGIGRLPVSWRAARPQRRPDIQTTIWGVGFESLRARHLTQ